jgi:IclR family mhp operon transcriptional activator
MSSMVAPAGSVMRAYKVKTIRSLERGLEVLQTLQEMRSASLHDLYLATGVPKATLTRILATLHQRGLVWRRMADNAFLPSSPASTGGPRRGVQVDDTAWLVELAAPVLERLCEKVQWPSVLSVPRLDHMEVIETNSPRAYFDDVTPFGPIGFRANLLRSASGRAYLAFCPAREREAVLAHLRERDAPGNELAHDVAGLRRLLETTRRRGYSVRDPQFGGHYAKTRAEVDDGRNSIAMPIRAGDKVVACVNLTWRAHLMTAQQAARRHLADLRTAVHAIEEGISPRPVVRSPRPAPASGAGRRP